MTTFTITHIDRFKHSNIMVVEGKVSKGSILIGDCLTLKDDLNHPIKVIGIPLGLRHNDDNIFLTFELHNTDNIEVGDTLFKQ